VLAVEARAHLSREESASDPELGHYGMVPANRMTGEPLVPAIAIVAEVDDDEFHLLDDCLRHQMVERDARSRCSPKTTIADRTGVRDNLL
jgi:hypothetical protein